MISVKQKDPIVGSANPLLFLTEINQCMNLLLRKYFAPGYESEFCTVKPVESLIYRLCDEPVANPEKEN